VSDGHTAQASFFSVLLLKGTRRKRDFNGSYCLSTSGFYYILVTHLCIICVFLRKLFMFRKDALIKS